MCFIEGINNTPQKDRELVFDSTGLRVKWTWAMPTCLYAPCGLTRDRASHHTHLAGYRCADEPIYSLEVLGLFRVVVLCSNGQNFRN